MYEYQSERPAIFTERGTDVLIRTRDCVKKLLSVSGAFQEQAVKIGGCYDSWALLAAVDYLCERGEIRRIYESGARQEWVYVSGAH